MPVQRIRVEGLPEPSSPHIAHDDGRKVEKCADVDSTKADSDRKSYRLIKLANGLRALLVHDPSAFPSSNPGNTREEQDRSDDDDDDDDEDDDDEDEDDCDESDSEGEGSEEGEGEEDRASGPGHDEGVKKAAAAMLVGVGSLSDPHDCQGLAHYLEHMLFMGSTKYPDENEYDSFISQRGGSSNAFTECEYTLYHFDVLPQHLDKALDIFAQFFVSPLMKADSSDRELQSIESEFCLVKNSDALRLQELWCHTCKRDHPYSKFSWGNLWSLRDMPQSKGIDVRKELFEFHARHYRAPAMQLVVLGGQSLDELQDMVVDSFSAVSAGSGVQNQGGKGKEKSSGEKVRAEELSKESAAVAAAGMPFDANALGKAFRLQPVKDVHLLYVTWQLREQHSLYKKKPCEYIAHLIGHEGEGSVLSLLRHRRWATGVTAGVTGSGHNNSSCCATFCVSFYLTKAGVRNWLDIVDVLFRYVGMLRRNGPQKWVFQEIRDIASFQYRFQEESDPAQYVEQLAEQMLPANRFDDLHILKGPYVVEDWDPELIEEILGKLSPEAARYDIQSSLFGRAVDAATDGVDTNGEGVAVEGNGKGKKRAAATDCILKDDGSMDDEEEDDDEDEEDDDEDEEDDDDHEEEEVEGQYHDFCKKPEVDPLEEPRFGLRYWIDPLPQEVLSGWRSSLCRAEDKVEEDEGAEYRTLSSHSSRAPLAETESLTKEHSRENAIKEEGNDAPELALPKPNPFIPSDFDIKKAEPWYPDEGGGEEGKIPDDQEGVSAEVKPYPRRIARKSAASERDTMVTLWHHQDRVFRQPRAEIYLKVVTSVCNESARAAALSELVVQLVNESLTEFAYAAFVTELEYSLKATDAGFQIHVYGFDHKAPKLLKEVLERLLDLGPHLKEGPLAMQLEALGREYHNTDMKPGKHAANLRIRALRKGTWSPEQKQASLDAHGEGTEPGVSLADVEAFLKRLFHRIEVEGLVHGNFTEDEARDVLEDIQKVADMTAAAAKNRAEKGHVGHDSRAGKFSYPEERVVRLDPSQLLLYCCPSKDPTEQNCALEVYWQIGEDKLEERVLADAIEQVMAEPLFDQLRTKEQLGYTVRCSPRVTSGVLGYCVSAQSVAYGPSHLYARICAFMRSFRDNLADMKDEAFETQMASVAANKLEPENSLSEEAERFWPEIYSRRRAFNVNVQEAHGMRELKKGAVLAAYEQWFCSGDANKACLTVAVTGGGKFSPEKEASALKAKAMEEEGGSGVSRKCVQIATPVEAFCPSDGRDVFPNLV